MSSVTGWPALVAASAQNLAPAQVRLSLERADPDVMEQGVREERRQMAVRAMSHFRKHLEPAARLRLRQRCRILRLTVPRCISRMNRSDEGRQRLDDALGRRASAELRGERGLVARDAVQLSRQGVGIGPHLTLPGRGDLRLQPLRAAIPIEIRIVRHAVQRGRVARIQAAIELR